MTTSLISVVLPVYNQADHAELVVREYEEVLERLPVPHELVLVVNGSSDASLDVCRTLKSQLDTVRSCTPRSVDGAVRCALASKPREVTFCATRTLRARALKIWLWCCSTQRCSRMSS